MYSFTKRVPRIFGDKSFNEAYYTPKLWMFFRESRETKEDIECIFHQIRGKMKERIILKKKSDPGKFSVTCMVGGHSYLNVLLNVL